MRKLKLLLAACALFGVTATTWAQTDVTRDYLSNADFETNPIFDGTSLGSGADPKSNAAPTEGSTLIEGAVNSYQISGWTSMTTETSDFARVFTMPYNTTLYVKGNGADGAQAVASPENGSSVTPSNNTLLFIEANWCQNAILGIKQTTTLPVGVYKLSFDSYVSNTIENASSLCGVKIGDVTTYKWPTAKDTWTNNEIYFTLDVATDVELSMGYKKLGNVGGGASAFLFVDNIKLVQIKNVAAAAPTDVTNKISNANADAAWGSPWAQIGGLQQNVNTNNGYDGKSGFFEPSQWGSNSWAGTMYTDLTGLSNGLYTLKAAVQSAEGVHTRLIAGTSNSSEYPANGTSNGTIAADGSVVAVGSGVAGWNFGSTSAWVTDGTLRIGVYTAAWDKQKWTNIDNFTLTYIPASEFLNLDEYVTLLSNAKSAATAALDNSEYDNVTGIERNTLITCSTKEVAEQSVAAYEALIEEVNAALSAFTSAKTAYDAYAAEKLYAESLGMVVSLPTTAAEANVNVLKVAEYTYVSNNYSYGVELGSWTENNIISRTGQHWDGTETSGYKEMNNGWGSNSWTMSMNQNITLPAGNYVLKAAGRQATGKCQLSLVVKNGDEVIGTVANFPRGDTGLGINKQGVTSYDPEDPAGFANNGTGRGFEWRYVKFTLNTDATVNVAVNAEGNEQYQWVSFCNATVQTDNETNIALIAYNIALNEAKATQTNEAYTNVIGSEKTALDGAISADGSLNKNDKSAIEAATEALNTATEAFKNAKGSYDTYVNAKAATYPELPYADAAKYGPVTTALNAEDASSAADAVEKTAAINKAYRKYVESNALAEGIEGSENKTDLIGDPNMDDVTYNGDDHTFGAWQVIGQTNGTINLYSWESFTDGNGKNDYNYVDIYKNDNNAGIEQTINLTAGKYMLTVTARANTTAGAAFWVFAGSSTKSIQRMGNSGGVFGRGWNDASVEFFMPSDGEINIGVQSGNGKDLWWSATRFRLVRLGDAVENVEVTAAGYATYTSDYGLDFTGKDIKAYTAKVEGGKIVLTKIDKVAAGTPVVLYCEGGKTESIPMLAGEADDATGNQLVRGTGAEIATEGEGVTNYILNNVNNKIGFYKANNQKVAKNRAYLPVSGGSDGARLTIVFADATGVSDVRSKMSDISEEIYNLNGQRVANAKKGLYIIGGKKKVIK